MMSKALREHKYPFRLHSLRYKASFFELLVAVVYEANGCGINGYKMASYYVFTLLQRYIPFGRFAKKRMSSSYSFISNLPTLDFKNSSNADRPTSDDSSGDEKENGLNAITILFGLEGFARTFNNLLDLFYP